MKKFTNGMQFSLTESDAHTARKLSDSSLVKPVIFALA